MPAPIAGAIVGIGALFAGMGGGKAYKAYKRWRKSRTPTGRSTRGALSHRIDSARIQNYYLKKRLFRRYDELLSRKPKAKQSQA